MDALPASPVALGLLFAFLIFFAGLVFFAVRKGKQPGMPKPPPVKIVPPPVQAETPPSTQFAQQPPQPPPYVSSEQTPSTAPPSSPPQAPPPASSIPSSSGSWFWQPRAKLAAILLLLIITIGLTAGLLLVGQRQEVQKRARHEPTEPIGECLYMIGAYPCSNPYYASISGCSVPVPEGVQCSNPLETGVLVCLPNEVSDWTKESVKCLKADQTTAGSYRVESCIDLGETTPTTNWRSQWYLCPTTVEPTPTSTPACQPPRQCVPVDQIRNCQLDTIGRTECGTGEVCCELTVQPTPTATRVPPTLTPAAGLCNQSCTVSSAGDSCAANLSCTQIGEGRLCRNPSCPDEPNCVCAPQCQTVKIYDPNWNQLTVDDLKSKTTGDEIRIAAVAPNQAAVSKARMRIKQGEVFTDWEETTNLKPQEGTPTTKEFYIEYIFPPGVFDFTVEAEIWDGQRWN